LKVTKKLVGKRKIQGRNWRTGNYAGKLVNPVLKIKFLTLETQKSLKINQF